MNIQVPPDSADDLLPGGYPVAADHIRGDSHEPASPWQFHCAIEVLGLPDPRRAVRIPCLLPTFYRPVALQLPVEGEAEVVDISTCGIRLRTREWIAPGSFLSVLFSRACQLPPIIMKVIHSHHAGANGFRVGGAWVRRLDEQQLQALLASPTTFDELPRYAD
jgi:hypothetical protein